MCLSADTKKKKKRKRRTEIIPAARFEGLVETP